MGTFGERTGIHSAVAATDGAGPFAIRIDSQVNSDTLWRARQLLDGLGAIDTRIIASGGVTSIDHLQRLSQLGVEGAIIGRALCTGDIRLDKALAALEKKGTIHELGQSRTVDDVEVRSEGSHSGHNPGL